LRDLNTETAKAILDAVHASWSAGDLEGLLARLSEDICYQSNTGSANGSPITLLGREQLGAYLSPMLQAVESMTVVDSFRYEDGVARAQVIAYVRHKTTGHVMTGTYRQVVHFQDAFVCKLDEFHDAARMVAFWKLVSVDAELEDAYR
jgi:ketosteroid isomerase-like protein